MRPSIRLPAILSPLLRGDFEDRPAQPQARDASPLRCTCMCAINFFKLSKVPIYCSIVQNSVELWTL